MILTNSKKCEKFHTNRAVCGPNKKNLELMISRNELDPIRLTHITNNCRSRNTNTTGRDFYGMNENCEDITCQSICNDDKDCEIYSHGHELKASNEDLYNKLKL